MANEYRSSWVGFEVYNIGSASIRATWAGLEVYHVGSASIRTSWIGLETFQSGSAAARVSWIGLEVFYLRTLPELSTRGFLGAQGLPLRPRRGIDLLTHLNSLNLGLLFPDQSPFVNPQESPLFRLKPFYLDTVSGLNLSLTSRSSVLPMVFVIT